MKVMKRWIPGICTEGPFEGCPVLNDEFDGTFYIIEDTQDNVTHLCDKLNTSCTDAEQFNEYLSALKDIDMPFGNIENFKEMLAVYIWGVDTAAEWSFNAWNDYVTLDSLWTKLYGNDNWDDLAEEVFKRGDD